MIATFFDIKFLQYGNVNVYASLFLENEAISLKLNQLQCHYAAVAFFFVTYKVIYENIYSAKIIVFISNDGMNLIRILTLNKIIITNFILQRPSVVPIAMILVLSN